MMMIDDDDDDGMFYAKNLTVVCALVMKVHLCTLRFDIGRQ